MSDPNARRSNRLAGESSPYLLLHAHNPVDWYPWGAEALERARREDKPIFLSVGYSTCFWCHVMERESFSDPAIAALMNEEFVNIKVDREERGDLDEIYMLATQVLAGQGGWPNSVFLTPDLKPFFAGTYFPPLDGHGRPGFPTVLRSMIHAWKERRAEVEEQGEELAGAIRHHLAEIPPFAGPLPGAAPAEKALASLRQRFDATWGGFGGAPKFPTPASLFHLLAFAAAEPDAATMLAATLDGMARGGIFDQLAGGFHRYSTDREWRVPHFEKMLYDNGLLLELYARDFERSANPESERVARATASFLAAEMTAPDGGLWSAIDAETGGREGAYYVWTRDEIELALGREESAFLAPLLGFDGAPFFEEGRYVLHLPRPLEAQAGERRTTRAALIAEIEPLRARLLATRSRRRRPATDDKILADWNGIAIAGLAVAGQALAEPAYVERARNAADFVLARMRTDDGTLLHAWRAGRGRIAAALADYAFLVRGLLRLHDATAEGRWLEAAIRLSEEQLRRLGSERGGFFNSADSPDLLVRAKELFDGALPGANAVAAHNLLDLHELTGEGRWLEAAERTARAFTPLVDRHAEGAKTMSLVLARLGPRPGAAAAAPAGASPLITIGRGRGAAAAAERPDPRAVAGDPPTLRREAESVVVASARLDSGGDLDGGWQPLRVRLAIADGWHLAAESLRVDGIDMELGQVTLPPPDGESAPSTAVRQAAYRGAVEIVALARARADLPQALPRILVRYQACDDRRCLPEIALELELGEGGGG